MKRITKNPSEKIVTDFKLTIRNHYSSEEKIRIMLDGLRGEVCRISSPSITVELSIIFMFTQKTKMYSTHCSANNRPLKEQHHGRYNFRAERMDAKPSRLTCWKNLRHHRRKRWRWISSLTHLSVKGGKGRDVKPQR